MEVVVIPEYIHFSFILGHKLNIHGSGRFLLALIPTSSCFLSGLQLHPLRGSNNFLSRRRWDNVDLKENFHTQYLQLGRKRLRSKPHIQLSNSGNLSSKFPLGI